MSTPLTTLGQMKRFVPTRFKRRAQDALLDRKFRRAVCRVSDLRLGDVPNRELLSDLIIGWGNEGFAAQLDYLEQVASQAARTDGPILECGSGLTSIILGLLAGRRGIETYSLEHFPDWRERVNQALERFEIANVKICWAPLRRFDAFDWYDAPMNQLPNKFRLVICDGPPGETRGGRYGLLPAMRGRLSSGSTVLLDDAARPGEIAALERWSRERSFRILSAPESSFALFELE